MEQRIMDMGPIVISVAWLLEDEEERKAALLSDKIRAAALNYCWDKVPGYKYASRRTKNKVYDRVRQMMEKRFGAEKEAM